MKLFSSPTSPFARKVHVTAAILGISDRIEIVGTATTPVDTDEALAAANPLGKLPALVTDDGDTLYDSRVICEYLVSLADNDNLLPAAGAARWAALCQQTLADGLMEAAILRRYEVVLRPEDKRSTEWDEAQKEKIERTLDAFELGVDDLADEPTSGTIAIGCALGYLDLRFRDEGWRQDHPKLAEWYEAWAQLPAMQATHVPD